MSSKWAPNSTPCTPAWWNSWGCSVPRCSPCSWTVPPDLPQAVAPMSPYYPFAPYAPPYMGYGFDQGCCSPPPSPWVPRQIPPPYARLCPSYYVGGSCCDECQTGAPCAGASPCCEACAGGAPCTCSPSAPGAPAAMVRALAQQGAHVGAVYVSDAELDALGSQVAIMGGDVNASADREHTADAWDKASAGMKLCHAAALTWNRQTGLCEQKPDPTFASYAGLDPNEAPSIPLTRFRNERWTPFQNKWNGYRAETFHAPTTYDTLRTEFASLLAEWIGPLGQKTTATVPKPLSESEPFPWRYVYLGGALLLLPFYLPVLSGLYLFLTKGKSLGLSASKAMKEAA